MEFYFQRGLESGVFGGARYAREYINVLQESRTDRVLE